MDIDDVRRAVALVAESAKGIDCETAHAREDHLLWIFVTAVAEGRAGAPDHVGSLAREILECRRICFTRRCG